MITSYTTELNKDNWDYFLSEGVVLVDLYAEWCEPCRVMGVIVDEISNEMHEKVKFGKLDIDTNKDIANTLHIVDIPTFLIYKDGEICQRLVGTMTKENIIFAIEEIL